MARPVATFYNFVNKCCVDETSQLFPDPLKGDHKTTSFDYDPRIKSLQLIYEFDVMEEVISCPFKKNIAIERNRVVPTTLHSAVFDKTFNHF